MDTEKAVVVAGLVDEFHRLIERVRQDTESLERDTIGLLSMVRAKLAGPKDAAASRANMRSVVRAEVVEKRALADKMEKADAPELAELIQVLRETADRFERLVLVSEAESAGKERGRA